MVLCVCACVFVYFLTTAETTRSPDPRVFADLDGVWHEDHLPKPVHPTREAASKPVAHVDLTTSSKKPAATSAIPSNGSRKNGSRKAPAVAHVDLTMSSEKPAATSTIPSIGSRKNGSKKAAAMPVVGSGVVIDLSDSPDNRKPAARPPSAAMSSPSNKGYKKRRL